MSKRSNMELVNELAIFAGAGGGILASKLLGHRTVCAVERDSYSAAVLAQRQNDGILEPFPIWSDVLSFDGKPWRGIVDIISAGFPCQGMSSAGKMHGFEDERSSLWFEAERVIGEIYPKVVFIENSPNLRKKGLSTILTRLSSMGYQSAWGIIGASCFGAPHQRKRLWCVSADSEWLSKRKESCRRETRRMGGVFKPASWNRHWKDSLSEIRGMDDGLARSVDRTDAIRNGQVPVVAAYAFQSLLSRLEETND